MALGGGELAAAIGAQHAVPFGDRLGRVETQGAVRDLGRGVELGDVGRQGVLREVLEEPVLALHHVFDHLPHGRELLGAADLAVVAERVAEQVAQHPLAIGIGFPVVSLFGELDEFTVTAGRGALGGSVHGGESILRWRNVERRLVDDRAKITQIKSCVNGVIHKQNVLPAKSEEDGRRDGRAARRRRSPACAR